MSSQLLLILVFIQISTPSPTRLIISELCSQSLDLKPGFFGNYSLEIISSEEFCRDPSNILNIISKAHTPILGSFEPNICSPVQYLSQYWNISVMTWNCPQENDEDLSGDLGPSISHIIQALSKTISHMKWRSIAVISSRTGWWQSLSHSLVLQLREMGITPKFYSVLPMNSTTDQIQNKLNILNKMHCRAIIVCTSGDNLGQSILQTLDNMQVTKNQDTLIVLIDISLSSMWMNYLINSETNHTNSQLSNQNSFSEISKKSVLIFSEMIFSNVTVENFVKMQVEKYFTKSKSDFDFVLYDLEENDVKRVLLEIKVTQTNGVYLKENKESLQKWLDKHIGNEECEYCEEFWAQILGFGIIVGSSFISIFILFIAAFMIRSRLLKKRITKGPYKVLLTATDFVFPQLPDSRRVDEGIEAMLCCWLQQLQEFGGPEVEKPDLLQGSNTNTKTPLRSGSSPSLAKQLIIDPRVRYNGDLVQMKPLPMGCIELKAKSVEYLILLHGLRHENLNPFIGCLAEPPRPCLVLEWCARGSLQDVLQQDDIKLDWSFRLSLLTDLVRGMKYLHSTPIKVHGFLTSRNCVIDARWVLKVTDYGLAPFYDYQGITPEQKSSRDKLWSAPEILRHTGSKMYGTQPGDVYSFGIIMQEVVVRGEPFCMLALTPEEIIEKIKRPPPLIRPSVSKGAAPPEAINVMRQCWAEQPEMRPDFNTVHDQFKKLNHGRKVNIVDTMFQMLEKYSNNLEELVRERTEQLDIEKKKTEQLLNRMLPSSVAEKLKLGMHVDPEEFDEVTIYFSDIVGFTTISAHSTPFQVVDLLNDLYTCFDATINAYNVYKVETIGDAYMVVGGLPLRIPDHAEQVATMALHLLHESGRFCIRHLPGTPLRLRIGLHTGPCCAGVVGLTMPRYCLFGDTVNTASRMESTGAPWRIHLSNATKEKLEKAGGYHLDCRGPINIKGKGIMHTYWLLGKAGFDKTLPEPTSIELDESLIKENSQPCDESNSQLQIDTQVEVHVNTDNTESGNNRSYPHDPTFIKTMEYSKFASLNCSKEHASHHIVKSSSSDTTTLSIVNPISSSEVAATLLGASTTSLYGFRGRPRRIEEEDLSSHYNHYKCLSPSNKLGKSLRRQFSLDRTEELINEHEESAGANPRLCKQNSAGAAAELQRIEEATTSILSLKISKTPQCSLSVSVDSLMQ